MLDKFDHRIDSFNAVFLQVSVATEDLVRNNYGSITSDVFLLKPEKEEIVMSECLDFIKEARNINGVKYTLSHDRDYFLIDPKNFVIQINVYDYSSEYDCTSADTYDDCVEGVLPNANGLDELCIVKSLRIQIFRVDSCNINADFEKISKKFGFTKMSYFSVGKNKSAITFAFPGMKGPEYATQSFSPLSLQSIECNYTPHVIENVRKFINVASDKAHGIFLINGPVGVGKSYLIKSMISEMKNRRAIVCSPPTEFLVRAGLLRQVATNFRKSLIIFEDVGELVAIDSANRFEDARANLLNLSEGLMSLILDGVIVISFNYEIEKIDPAILRPGRCLAHIEVGKLPYTQAKSLVPFDISNREYSLAEIYEMRNTGKEMKAERKLGF